MVEDDYEHPEPGTDPSWAVPTDAPTPDVQSEVLVENLEVPWDLAFADSGELFITERTGRVLRFDAGEVSEVARPQDAIDAGSVEPGSAESEWFVEGGEGGTLGVAVHPDGSPLSSNPDHGGDPRVFSYGHRNPQGLDWLPDGVPICSEHGPGGRDEVNLLVPGGNYGWPDARGGPADEKYDSYVADDLIPPVLNTGPDSGYAPTGATFYTGKGIPSWRNRFIVGGLISQSLWAITLTPPDYDRPPGGDNGRRYDEGWLHSAYTATVHRLLPDELGRIRHVAESPDGDLYAITSNRDGRATDPFPTERDDVLVRLTPG